MGSKLNEAAMDGEGLNPDSDYLPNKCAKILNRGIDRISELPNEILSVVLSFLPVRKAAATTVLSSRWLDLWKQIPNIKFNLESDRISQLPDPILLVILSFLSLREAAATSVLSSRWSDLWRHSPYLDFDTDYLTLDAQLKKPLWNHGYMKWCKSVVNSVIQMHKALSLKQFRICFPVDRSAKSTVTKWLEFAFSRQVECLELNFSVFDDRNMVILEESLREMSLTCGAPKTLFFYQSLERLHLGFLKVGGEDIELFLRNCPLLEELSIRFAPLTSDINVCGATLMLKHLDILYCNGSKSLRVSAPNLISFNFSNTIGKLVVEYAPELIKAKLCSSSSEFFVQHKAHISQLQMLKLTFSDPKEPFMDKLFLMPNLKKLYLYCFRIINHSLLPLTALIWASPCLEEFNLKLDCNPSALMEDITNVERCPHQHLKVVEVKMHSDVIDHLVELETSTNRLVELVTYLSDNCVALRKISVRCSRSALARHGEFQAELVEQLKQLLQGQVRSEIQLSVDLLKF